MWDLTGSKEDSVPTVSWRDNMVLVAMRGYDGGSDFLGGVRLLLGKRQLYPLNPKHSSLRQQEPCIPGSRNMPIISKV